MDTGELGHDEGISLPGLSKEGQRERNRFFRKQHHA